MATGIFTDEQGRKVLACHTTGYSFGCIFEEDESPDEFQKYVGKDLRLLTAAEFDRKLALWRLGNGKL